MSHYYLGYLRSQRLFCGAFYSIFCVEDAEMIGLDYTKGKRSHVVVGDGNALTFISIICL